MAPFNPALQPNTENFREASGKVSVPDNIKPEGVAGNTIQPRGVETPDRSAEYLGKAAGFAAEAEGASTKGLGDLFAGITNIADYGIKVTDTFIKKDIERQVYDVSNKEREDYTKRLEDTLAGTGKKSLFDANASMDAEVPDELEGLGDSLASLKSASDSGKISNTYYTGRLLAQAKEMRAKYPGYRQYIDDQFAQVTGMNPANARINALTQDINRALTSQNSQKNGMIKEILKNPGYAQNGIDSSKAIQKVESGEWTSMSDIVKWRAPLDQQRATLEVKKMDSEDKNLTDTERQKASKEAVFTLVNQRTANLVNNIESRADITSIDDIRTRIAQGSLDANGYRQMVQNAKMSKQTIIDTVWSEINDGGKNSLAIRTGMTPTELRGYIENNVKSYDILIEALENKDGAGVHIAANYIKDKTNENTIRFMTNNKIGNLVQMDMAAKQMLEGSPTLLKLYNERLVSKDYSGRWAEGFRSIDQEISTQSQREARGGAPMSVKDGLTALQKEGGLTPRNTSKLINKPMDILRPDVSDNEKFNIIEGTFSPANRGAISKLEKDGVDAQGRPVPGQWAAFTKWTSPEMTAEVKRLSARDFRVWTNYKNWAEETLGSELLSREFKDLNNISKEPNVRLEWKTTENGIRRIEAVSTITPEQRRALGGESTARFGEIQRLTERVNSGLYSYSNIAKADNSDVDAYMLRTFRNMGINMNTQQPGYIRDLVENIIASRTKPEPEKKTK